MSAGLILLAHGARDPRWAASFETIVERVRAARPDAKVSLAFLELMAPDLPRAASTLVEAGCKTIEVVPLFLGAGGHVRKDLPAMLDSLCALYRGATFTLHAPVGEAEIVIDAMVAAAIQTLPAR